MRTDFHCVGTVDLSSEMLKRCVRGKVMAGAASLINQSGNPSRPIDVGFILSSILKTLYSVNICCEKKAVDFCIGGIHNESLWIFLQNAY